MSRKSDPTTPEGGRPPTRDSETDDGDRCDITIDLDLEGVRPSGLQNLRKGDRLSLKLEPAGGYEFIVCVRADGVIVGAIANFRNHTTLLNCLRRGVPYVVTVTDVRPGGCHVNGGRADK